MAGYGWTAYDVRKGGIQLINDTGNKLDLITEFAKISGGGSDGEWGLRVRGIPRADAVEHQKTTVIFYLGNGAPNSSLNCTAESRISPSSSDVVCEGMVLDLGSFSIGFPDNKANSNVGQGTSVRSLKVSPETVWQAKSVFIDQLNRDSHEGIITSDPGHGNLHFVQKMFEGSSFEFDVLTSAMTSDLLTTCISDASITFDKRFESMYAPQAPFQNEQYVRFSQSLLSNLMGGIGYFDGTSEVDVSSATEYAETDENFWEKAASARSRAVIEEQGPYQLFSAVPSRPFFPRGFLWDEGFHLLVVLDWDMDLALEIVMSWLDLMDEDGWIAREQILGPEARDKVPAQFQTQYPHYANPPTLFMVIEAVLWRIDLHAPYKGVPSRYMSDAALGKAFLEEIYPKLKKHYGWFRRTQNGTPKNYQVLDSQLNQGYRWRGRTPQHILTSGLDDYPRAQPPHPEELHLDALCWVGSMAGVLKKIAAFLGEDGDQQKFSKHKTDIARSIDSTHWSEPDLAYCDITMGEGNQVQRVCHKGYISLFPFLVNLMHSNHPYLGAVLDLIRDPKELWSSHGIRSLSTKDKYYGTDENYWRSPIWININYLILLRLLVSTP